MKILALNVITWELGQYHGCRYPGSGDVRLRASTATTLIIQDQPRRIWKTCAISVLDQLLGKISSKYTFIQVVSVILSCIPLWGLLIPQGYFHACAAGCLSPYKQGLLFLPTSWDGLQMKSRQKSCFLSSDHFDSWSLSGAPADWSPAKWKFEIDYSKFCNVENFVMY